MELKRNSYDAGFKLKIVAYAEENGNANAERYFNVDEMNIRRWWSMKDDEDVDEYTADVELTKEQYDEFFGDSDDNESEFKGIWTIFFI